MKQLIIFIIILLPVYSYSAELVEITTSIKEICHTPENGTSTHYKVTAKGNTSLKVKFLGKLGGEAKFSKEEWDGVQRVLRKDVATDRKDYRLCVRTLSPLFIKKYNDTSSTSIKNDNKPKKKNYIKTLLLPNKPTNCKYKSVYYLANNKEEFLGIRVDSPEEEIISPSSNVSIWKNNNYIIIPSGWAQVGTYSPKKGRYMMFANTKPSRLINTKDIIKNEPVAIIQYQIRRMRKGKNNNHLAEGRFKFFEYGGELSHIKLATYFDKSTLSVDNYCQYIHLK